MLSQGAESVSLRSCVIKVIKELKRAAPDLKTLPSPPYREGAKLPKAFTLATVSDASASEQERSQPNALYQSITSLRGGRKGAITNPTPKPRTAFLPTGRLGGGRNHEQSKVGHHHQARNRHPQRHRRSTRSHSVLLRRTDPPQPLPEWRGQVTTNR